MHSSATPTYEEQRIAALRRLALLDTPPEPEFDAIVELAAAICGAPISMVSLVDEERQWFKAVTGLDITGTPREVAFCDHAIRQPDLLLVEDATLDSRFAQNPMVKRKNGWRFYAGIPVTDPGGFAVGTLCVMDLVPRTLSIEQRDALRILAGQVNAWLELRIKRRKLEQALAHAEAARVRLSAGEKRFQDFMDSGPFLAYLKDTDGRLLYYNERMARHFNVSRSSLLNKADHELWAADTACLHRKHDEKTLLSGQLHVVEERSINPDGAISVWRSYKFPCTDANGDLLLGGVSLDVTAELERAADLEKSQLELEEANRQLRELASIDALTGLANRRTFDEHFRVAFRRARRSVAPLCVLMLDVDHFKTHNDRFGHAHGDRVLRTLAQVLKDQIRAGDLLARYGGEEFVVLLSETEEAQGRLLASRLLEAIQAYPWPLLPVTISIGLGALSPATPDTSHLLTLADEALYAAKCGGRNRVVAYTDIFSQTLKAARERAAKNQHLDA